MERDLIGDTRAYYTRGLSYGGGIGSIISAVRGTDTHYYHYNGIGSVTNLTDNGGNLIQSYIYDAFGNILQVDSYLKGKQTVTNPYRFSTKEYNSKSGLIYFGARYYDPRIGRFVTKDPFPWTPDELGTFFPDPTGFAVGDVNLYTYCWNSPLTYIDPLGLRAEKPWWQKWPLIILGGGQWHTDYGRGGEKLIEIFYKGAKYRFNKFGQLVDHTGRVIGKAVGKAAKALKYLKNVKPSFFRMPVIIIIIPPEMRADPTSPFYDPKYGPGMI
jgi:RHS repeat-associated protein